MTILIVRTGSAAVTWLLDNAMGGGQSGQYTGTDGSSSGSARVFKVVGTNGASTVDGVTQLGMIVEHF